MFLVTMKPYPGQDPNNPCVELFHTREGVVDYAVSCWRHGDALIERIDQIDLVRDVTDSFSDPIDTAIAVIETARKG